MQSTQSPIEAGGIVPLPRAGGALSHAAASIRNLPRHCQTGVWVVGTDFFTAEVLTLKGLKTYYVLLFLHLESRRICLAGLTRHPDQKWMEQMRVTSQWRNWISD